MQKGKKGISDSENKRKYILFSASKIAKNKNAISEVVTTVLMVLLALGAILLVWFLVRNLISNAGEQIDLSKLTLSFTIPGNSVYVNQPLKSVSFVVQREAGAGTVSGLKVIVTDTSGQSVTQNVAVALGELESKSVSISYASSSLGQIAKVSVAPIVKSASGNEQTGSVAAEYSVTSANLNGALKFDYTDGTNDYINMGNKLLFAGTSDFTISAWINLNVMPGLVTPARILEKRDYSLSANPGFQFDIRLDGSMALYICDGSAGRLELDSATKLTTGKWYNIIVSVKRSGSAIYYLNGVQDNSFVVSTQQGSIQSSADLLIGADYTKVTNNTDGTMRDIRVYNKALGSDEAAKLYNNGAGDDLGTVATSNLVGWWKLDDGQGATAADSSGNGNTGTIIGNPIWVSS